MKNLYKKAGTVALVGMMVFGGSGLSQGFVAHADSCSGMSCLESINNYDFVVKCSTKFNYTYKQLRDKPKSLDAIYADRWKFRDNIKSLLDTFRNKKDFVNIEIGNSHYRLFFRQFIDNDSQNVYEMVSEAGAKYGFSIFDRAYALNEGSLIEMQARIRTKLADNPKLVDELLKGPVLYYHKEAIENSLKTLDQLFGVNKNKNKNKHYVAVGINDVIFILKK